MNSGVTSELIETVVTAMVGPITPVGDSAIDYERQLNLMVLEDATSALIDRIVDLMHNRDSSFGSVSDIGKEAYKWVSFWKEELESELDDGRKAAKTEKVAHWIALTDCADQGVYCSHCQKKVYKLDYSNTMKMRSKFCPNCGFEMLPTVEKL